MSTEQEQACAGKLDCYVAAAGFSPTRVLPVVIDVGTDNEALRNDPLYTGLKQERICGQEYFEVSFYSACRITTICKSALHANV